LADASRQSRFLPRLYANPLNCVDSRARPPPAVQQVLGSSFRGQFDVRNRLPLSVFQLLSLLLTKLVVVFSIATYWFGLPTRPSGVILLSACLKNN
jgi:hypothetical protein